MKSPTNSCLDFQIRLCEAAIGTPLSLGTALSLVECSSPSSACLVSGHDYTWLMGSCHGS